jgi:hypothetical protein
LTDERDLSGGEDSKRPLCFFGLLLFTVAPSFSTMRGISLISLSLLFCNDVPSMVVTAFAPPIKASPWKLQRTSSSCSSSSSSKTSSSSSFQTKHLSVAATKLHLLPEATSSILTAAGPDWGIFEGRTLSLLHPVMMFSMLGLSLYTALLGFQWRRQRTIGDDISALKKTLPSITEETFKEALAAAKEAGDSSKVTLYENAISTEQEISSLTAERKELSQKNPRDAHFSRGALLAFIGTVFAIEVRRNERESEGMICA